MSCCSAGPSSRRPRPRAGRRSCPLRACGIRSRLARARVAPRVTSRPRSPKEVWYNAEVRTELEEIADNKVRLRVDVPREDVKHAVEHAASDLAASAKIPGFRKGKVPMPVLVQRIGRERIFSEAVESHIGGWFWTAAAREGLRPVAQPDFDFQLPTTDKEGWRFTATVEVQPKPELPDWTQLEVPRREIDVPEELIQTEVD